MELQFTTLLADLLQRIAEMGHESYDSHMLTLLNRLIFFKINISVNLIPVSRTHINRAFLLSFLFCFYCKQVGFQQLLH